MHKHLSIITALALWLLVFAIGRLALLLLFPEQLRSLSLAELPMLLLQALPFDLKVIAWLLGPLLLVKYFPLPPALTRFLPDFIRQGWHALLALVSGLLLLACAVLLVADLRFYQESRNHIGVDIMALNAEFSLIQQIIWADIGWYSLALLLAITISAASTYAVYHARNSSRWGRSLASWCLLLIVLTIAARGGFDTRPLGPAKAYALGKERGDIVVNPIMTVGQNIIKAGDANVAKTELKFSPAQIQERARRYLGLPPEQALRRRYNYQLLDAPSNIVVIVIESLSWQYLDALSGADYGVTPHLDALSRDSYVYQSFYASGPRSIDTVQPLLFNLPTFPGLPTLLTGIEQKALVGLGDYAARVGYRSLLSQSFRRNSFYLDAHAARAGFQEYYGQEDTPPTLEYTSAETPYGGYDYEHLQLVCARISHWQQQGQPILSISFTGRTHTPLVPTLSRFELYPPDSQDNKFLNALAYSDWAIGEFLACARAQGWYQNTVFLITSDHPYKHGDARIPLLIHAPAHKHSLNLRQQAADNLALFPSIVQLLGYQDSFNSFAEGIFLSSANAAQPEPYQLWRRSAPLVRVTTPAGEVQLNEDGSINYSDAPEELSLALQARYLSLRWLVANNSY